MNQTVPHTSLRSVSCASSKKFAFVLLVAMAIAFPATLQAQNYVFTGGADGAYPRAGVVMDAAGNLYGTTFGGGLVLNDCVQSDGIVGCGTVYKLSRQGQFSLLYSFQGGSDGYAPWGRVILGPDGALYGTTTAGGAGTGCSSSGCGTVFRLVPPATACPAVFCPWTEQIIHRFAQSEGSSPNGDLIFDRAGNLYGAAEIGAQRGGCCGIVYTLTPSANGWDFNIIHRFNWNDGAYPYSGVTFDANGNLYGTAWEGGANSNGVVYQLRPSGLNWNVYVLYNFGGPDDLYSYGPVGGVTLDATGNIYGSTAWGTQSGGGVLWSLSASNWRFSLLNSGNQCGGPYAQMTWGPDGNLYGAVTCGPVWGDQGALFALSWNYDEWYYNVFYDFRGESDGGYPESTIVFDSQGIMHGTTTDGGGGSCPYGCGVVWAMRP